MKTNIQITIQVDPQDIGVCGDNCPFLRPGKGPRKMFCSLFCVSLKYYAGRSFRDWRCESAGYKFEHSTNKQHFSIDLNVKTI
jgi:hypothetical protein